MPVFFSFFHTVYRTDLDLSGKTVLITGAASPAGIGHSLAIDLLNLPKAPSRLILWDIAEFVDFENGETRKSTTIITRNVDVTDYEKVNELIKNDGSIHVCVCNAGIGVGLKFKDMPFAKYMKTIDVNFLAKVQMTKTVLEHHFDTVRLKNLVWRRNLVIFEVFGVKFSAKKSIFQN